MRVSSQFDNGQKEKKDQKVRAAFVENAGVEMD